MRVFEEEEEERDPLLDRIERRQDSLLGRAKVKGQRYAVDYVLTLLANYRNFEKVCEQFPELNSDDLAACLVYASDLVTQDELKRLESCENPNR